MIKKNVGSSDLRILKLVEKLFREQKKRKKYFCNTDLPRITLAYLPVTDLLMQHNGFDQPVSIAEFINSDGYI